MHSHSQSVQYSKCGVRVVVIVCWPLCLSAMHHYHHIALNYNELTRTPLTLFHQCFPVERRHLRHYNNCSLTIAVPLVMRIQDGSGRDRLKFSPNIRQEHEIKACTLVFLYYLNDISNINCLVQCLTHDFIHLTVVFYIIHTPAEYVKMKHIGPNILSLLTHEVVIK